MLDPQGLYEITDDTLELGRPVLVQALTGFVDAGSATRLAREHLLATYEHTTVATFDVDQVLDYRSRRPVMDFVEDHWESYDDPVLELCLLRDADDTAFLLLTGPEPDLQWERFSAAVIGLVEHFGVRLTIGLNAIPMAVPHTRPTGVTAHATRPELITGYEPWLARVKVPASAGHLIEFRLGQHGHDAVGFAAHVPHYLAQGEYPLAAEVLLESVSRASGLLVPTAGLHSAAEVLRAGVDEQVAQDAEAAAVVTSLEQQYDAFVRGRAGRNLLAESGPLPSAEELGAELEHFLAQQSKPGEQPGG